MIQVTDEQASVPATGPWDADLDRILMSLPSRNPGDVIKDLWDLSAVMEAESAEAFLMANPGFLEYRPALTRAFYDLVVDHEISQARQIIEQVREGSKAFTEIASSISLYTYNRSAAMFDYLDFRDCRRMILVGCGWIPATLFHVHDNTDVPELVGLDVVPEAISTSNALARSLGYARVRTELQNGGSYDYGGAQIVYVVGMVSETKSAVLCRIADTAPDNVQVLVNEPYSLGRLWSEAVEPSLDPRFEIAARAPGRATRRDLILRRRADSISGAGSNSTAE